MDRDNILHNYRQFKSRHPNLGLAPVLKSNAYGHGLAEIAQILRAENPAFLCVDSLFEALTLRNRGIATPLLIIGYTPVENIPRRNNGVSFGIAGLDELRRIAQALRHPAKFHLKLDTGMHRHGIMPEQIGEAADLIHSNPNIILEGAYSHLADADTPGSAKTELQIKTWNESVRAIRASIPEIKYWHCANTAGSAYADRIEANVLRLGLGLYGISPLPPASAAESPNLLPALEVATRITSLRTVPAGESVGYNNTFQAERNLTVASIPMGYFEGVDRRLSNRGFVWVRDASCPIVGRVSMNIASIDVSGVPGLQVGDEAIVISKDPKAANSVEQIAKQCETMPWEILVHIPAHLRRTVI